MCYPGCCRWEFGLHIGFPLSTFDLSLLLTHSGALLPNWIFITGVMALVPKCYLSVGALLPAVSVPAKEVHALETIPLRPLFRHPLRPKPNRPRPLYY